MLTPVVVETHRLSPYSNITPRSCRARAWWRKIFIGRRWSA